MGSVQHQRQRRRLRLHRNAPDRRQRDAKHRAHRRERNPTGYPRPDAQDGHEFHPAGPRGHAGRGRRASIISGFTIIGLRHWPYPVGYWWIVRMKPLDGITVLDLTRLLPGAVATM